MMAEAFRNAGPELKEWSTNVLDVPPRRFARHLQTLGAALFVNAEAVRPQPGSAYDPQALDRLLGPQLHRACIERLKRAPLPRRRW
jgi:hypothetical protein